MAKKERNKNKLDHLFDYRKTSYGDYEYYGIHILKKRTYIDNKRLKKIGYELKNSELINLADKICKIPRHTTYYLPKKIYRDDYYINWFRDLFVSFRKEWNNTLNFISSIKTPKQQGDDLRLEELAYTSDMDDYDEISFHATMKMIKATPEYNYLILNLYTQFLHDVSIKVDALILKICTELGMNYNKEKMITRKNIADFIKSYTKGRIRMEEIPRYKDTYEKFCLINNFLKHNSENLYLKVKKKYPDLITNGDFTNGDLAQFFLKIDKDFVEKTFEELEYYFDEFCKLVLNEDIEEAKWNYDDYFKDIVRDEIDLYYSF